VEIDHGEWSTRRQLGRCLVTVRAVSDEAPAPRMAPAVAVAMGDPLPSNDLVWKDSIHQVISTSLGGNGGLGWVLPRGFWGGVYIRVVDS
jgi:hypothetical protein